MIDNKNIRDMNQVRRILENLRDYLLEYEKQIGELPEYKCEDINFQIAEIDGFIIGNQKINAANLAMGDIRVMNYWNYLDGKCNFDELMLNLKKYEGEV